MLCLDVDVLVGQVDGWREDFTAAFLAATARALALAKSHLRDGQDVVVPEAADLVEHVSAWLPGLIKEDDLIEALGFCAARRARLLGFRRLMAVFWLLMLLPGNPGHRRNPPGSAERQAQRVLGLL